MYSFFVHIDLYSDIISEIRDFLIQEKPPLPRITASTTERKFLFNSCCFGYTGREVHGPFFVRFSVLHSVDIICLSAGP